MKIALIASGLPRFTLDFIDLMHKITGFTDTADLYICMWKTDWAITDDQDIK